MELKSVQQEFNKVHEDNESVIYENGYWIKKKNLELTQKRRCGLDVNEKTKELTPFFI